MSQLAPANESGIRLYLNSQSGGPRDLSDLARDELESLRAAVEYTLATMPKPERPVRKLDNSFSCEWWPPD